MQIFITSIVFLITLTIVLSNDINTAICALVASTSVQTINSQWACTSGTPNTAICSLPGTTCASTTLTAIALTSISGTLPVY